MKIKEYNQMKAELIKDDRGDSTGAFINFVREQRALDQEPRTMAHGGRIGYDEGSSYEYKIKEIMGKHPGMTRPLAIRIIEAGISPDDYDAIAGLENKADGGRIGFGDGLSTERYNIIRPTTSRDFYPHTNAPKDSKYKISWKKSKAGTLPDEFQGTKFYKSKADANAAQKAKQKFILEAREAKKKPYVKPEPKITN